MNGARALVETLAAGGVTDCFANPGTTEVDLVHALDDVPAMAAHLVLSEAVATGAADGFGRLTGRPAATLLHLGPGYANGAANLHNAWRARTPIVNIVGDHATWHRPHDTGLASDVAALAGVHSGWVAEVVAPGPDAAAALSAASGGAIATLIVPADVQRAEAAPADPLPPVAPGEVPGSRVEAVAAVLARTEPIVLLLGGGALSTDGLAAAHAIAAATGARLLHETLPARIERGAGQPHVTRLPYAPPAAAGAIGQARVVLVGAHPPTSFFGYQGVPSHIVPTDRLVRGADPDEDVDGFLGALAAAVGAHPAPTGMAVPEPVAPTSGALDPATVGAAVAATQPEGAVVVNAAVTAGGPWEAASAASPPHTMLTIVGGSLGFGLPAAVGAAVAAPDRPVVALQADGSALYTPQALWSMAREGLDVTVVALVNRRYRIIAGELGRVTEPGPVADALTDIDGVDFVGLAESFGVPGRRVVDAADLVAALAEAFGTPGPHLVEVPLP
ncbi:MAG: acetolactate synthase large subunit [Acidimicrobiia bacterium]